MIRIEGVELWAGDKVLLRGAHWHVHPGDRVGLVGRNGAGKTTLLRAVAASRRPDASALVGSEVSGTEGIDVVHGTMAVRKDAVVGYLPQTAVSGSDAPLWAEVQSQMHHLNALQAALDRALAAVDAKEEGAIEQLDEAQSAFRLAGGYAREERVGEVLHGLGFERTDWERTCDTFSGGWQMRIALARLLLAEPQVMLLDEPTNHLDLHARSWLGRFLGDRTGPERTIVLVSHDRHLLDSACSRICEVRDCTLHHFTGSFSQWQVERVQRRTQAQAAYDAQQAEIARLERFVERFKATATKASQAQSRQKQLDRMERVEAPQREAEPRYSLPPAPPSSEVVLELLGADIGWPAGPVLLGGLELRLDRGMRLALLGPNGCGKSTLLRTLTGELPLRGGKLKRGRDLRVGVFAQDLAQALPADRTPTEQLIAEAPATTETRARTVLGAMGLSGELALQPIGTLSGGERARVALGAFALRGLNLLLLDEPSNHLDAETVSVLGEALAAFDGAMVLVTHDRHLVESVATHVAHVEGGRLVMHEGVHADDFQPKAGRASHGEGTSDDGGGAEAHAARKQRQRERQRLERQAAELAEQVEAHEARLEEIDAALVAAGADVACITELSQQRAATEQQIAQTMAAWEAAEEALAGD